VPLHNAHEAVPVEQGARVGGGVVAGRGGALRAIGQQLYRLDMEMKWVWGWEFGGRVVLTCDMLEA
jgi:hypothetical protein